MYIPIYKVIVTQNHVSWCLTVFWNWDQFLYTATTKKLIFKLFSSFFPLFRHNFHGIFLPFSGPFFPHFLFWWMCTVLWLKKGKKGKKRRSSIAHPSWRRRWSRHGAKNFVDNESQTALLTMVGVDKYHLKK